MKKLLICFFILASCKAAVIQSDSKSKNCKWYFQYMPKPYDSTQFIRYQKAYSDSVNCFPTDYYILNNDIESFKVIVVNRWGEILFDSDTQNNWICNEDSINNKITEGLYFAVANYSLNNDQSDSIYTYQERITIMCKD